MFIVDFFTNAVVIQIIGFVGMLLSIISFQSKSYQKIIWMRVSSEFVFALQYFLFQNVLLQQVKRPFHPHQGMRDEKHRL